MCDTEDQLLNVLDTDFITKKKLYETMGDGCVAVKNYAKALEYYRKMLEVNPSSLYCTLHVLSNVHDILNALVTCMGLSCFSITYKI
jgi:tetratricopeptide (TPR) repeat protein